MTDAAFWTKIAPKYAKDPISDMDGYTETRDRMRTILQPHHRVLEMGCGTGSTALELAPGVDRYIGTDIAPGMIEIAQAKQSDGAHANLRFAVHTADDIPSAPHDVIVALNLLHLLPNLEETLDRTFEALPSGGMFLAKTPLLKGGKWYIRLLLLVLPIAKALGKAPYVRKFDDKMLLQMMADAGFEVTETLSQSGSTTRFFTVARKP